MKYYLKDLLPRLKKYSAELDHAAFLVDKPWVVSGEQNEPFQKLIFRRDGKLHLSTDGELINGRWEYLSEAKCLVIDFGSSKKLYKHAFLDEAVLALKIDGSDTNNDEDFFLLTDENKVPDANAKLYLEEKLLAENSTDVLLLDDGKKIYIQEYNEINRLPEYSVSDGYEPIKDGYYYFDNGNKRIIVSNGFIRKTERKIRHNKISVWQSNDTPQINDDVVEMYIGNFNARVGTEFYYIDVNDGVISRITNRTSQFMAIVYLIVFLVFLYFFVIS